MEERPLTTRCWRLPYEVELTPVVAWCLEHRGVDRLMVVTRMRSRKPLLLDKPEVEAAIERIFGDRVLSRRYVRKWPGTRLLEHDALAATVDFSADLLVAMVAAEPSLYGWLANHRPPLPEDLCLWHHGDELPTLVSVSHEREAWILSDREVDLPGAVLDELTPEHLAIPPAELGFAAREPHWKGKRRRDRRR